MIKTLPRWAMDGVKFGPNKIWKLCTLSSYSSSQLNILWHDGHTLGMDCAQVCVLKQTNQVSLTCFLKSSNCCTLESKICLEVLSNLPNQSLEGELPDQQFCGLLVPPDLSQSHSTWPVPMWLLHTTC